MNWRDTDGIAGEFRSMPKFELSAEDKAKMLTQLKSIEAAVKVRRPRRWLMSALAAGSAIVVAGSLFFALEMKGASNKNSPATTTSVTAQPKHLEAATSTLQEVTDKFGPKAEELHQLLTHTVGLLDAWAYGKSEIPGQGDYSFADPNPTHHNGQAGVEPYLQADYDKFRQLFKTELAEMPKKPSVPGSSIGFLQTDREDWQILYSIDQAYQMALYYYSASVYQHSGYLEATPGNNTPAALAANTLREWNDLLFGGRIQLSDVPKVKH
ncbi:hypothetical protein [Alicyclobacillus macrosporangiidus]|nr:hypothetical protein [Alicyclobacillus macrosporangiidus]